MQESGHYELLAEMASQKDLKDRIGCVLHKRLELLAPNRKFCDLFSGMPPIPVIRFLQPGNPFHSRECHRAYEDCHEWQQHKVVR
jgi:hypothetical protein